MKPKITVFGTGSDAQVMAADLTLAGYQVNLLGLPEQKQSLEEIEKLGINLSGQETVSGKTGLAKPNMVTTDSEEALKDVKVIFLMRPEDDYVQRIEAIAPYLEDGQIINFNTFGHWPSLRVVEYIEKADKENVILTESPVPIYMTFAGYMRKHV